MKVGDIKKISIVYADAVGDFNLCGAQVIVTSYRPGSAFPVDAEILEGKYAGENWLFTEEELF